MSSAEIEVQFEVLIKLGEELRQTAAFLRQLADRAGVETIAAVKAAWVSENADVFAEKELRVMEKIGETAQGLAEAAEEVLEKADRLWKAESGNTLTARIRSYW